MQALLAPLQELADYGLIKDSIRKNSGPLSVAGCVDSQKLHMIYGLSDGLKVKVIVTYSDLKAKEIYEEYIFEMVDGERIRVIDGETNKEVSVINASDLSKFVANLKQVSGIIINKKARRFYETVC